MRDHQIGVSVRTDTCRVPGDNFPCLTAQEDITRITFLPTIMYSTKKVALARLAALKERASWMTPKTKFFLSSDSFVRIPNRHKSDVLGDHSSSA